jgi:hypothetical protein
MWLISRIKQQHVFLGAPFTVSRHKTSSSIYPRHSATSDLIRGPNLTDLAQHDGFCARLGAYCAGPSLTLGMTTLLTQSREAKDLLSLLRSTLSS